MIDREAMAKLMKQRLSRQMLAFLLASGVQAAHHEFQVFLVGGMVRDMLLNKPPGDPDLLVQETVPSMDAAVRFGTALAAAVGGSLSQPSEFGTVKLEAGGLVVDLVTARRETYASPGALPVVRPATIEGDMGRRDFTINAIAVDLAPNRFGTVTDLQGGMDDLDSHVLGVLHDDSFADDPTRGFRAARYVARLGLRMSALSDIAFRRDIGHVGELSGDRVRHELDRILAESAPASALSHASGMGLLEAVYPGLTWSPAMTAAARSLRDAGPLVYVALLASPLSSEDAKGLIERLNAPRAWAAVIEDTAALRERLPELEAAGLAPSQIYSMLESFEPEAVLAWAALSDSATASRRLRDYHDKLRNVQTQLSGDDLLALGVPQGPQVGELLRELLNARLDGQVSSRRNEEELVKRRLSA